MPMFFLLSMYSCACLTCTCPSQIMTDAMHNVNIHLHVDAADAPCIMQDDYACSHHHKAAYLTEWEDAVDDRQQLALVQKGERPAGKALHDLRLLILGPRSQRAADDLRSLGQHLHHQPT